MPIREIRIIGSADVRRIVKGSDVTINVELYDQYSKQVLDLDQAPSGVTAASALFVRDDGTALVKTLGAGVTAPIGPGRLAVDLTGADTALLRAGDLQSYELRVDFNGKVQIVKMDESLEVTDPLF